MSAPFYHIGTLITFQRANKVALVTVLQMSVVLCCHMWCGGATGKAFGLAISSSRVQILLEAMLRNNLRPVSYTHLTLPTILRV